MKKLYEQWPFNFGAIHEQDFKKAKILIAQIIYDATSSYMAGQREGPLSIIQASRFLDELLDSTGKLVGLKPTDIFTLDECVVSRNSVIEAMKGIEQFTTEEIIKKNKIPMVLGGEHSITYGVVKALKKKYPDLSVMQFDAHTDLIDEYEGSKYSHACVMRRVMEQGIKTVQIGIRNMNTEVADFIKSHKPLIFEAPGLPPIEKALKGLTKNVYLTFDLDAFDPSIMPS